MSDLFVDLRPAGEYWQDLYGDPTLTSVRIGENNHRAFVLLSLEHARILAAACDLYEAVKKSNDFLTPCDEAVKAELDALDKAEGKPKGERLGAYLANREEGR